MAKKKSKDKVSIIGGEYGKNVRIPLNEYNTIKEFVTEKKYTLGGFIALAALEKIGRIRKANQ
jgi:lipid-binding SYLF domain-containing protein